MTIGAHYMDETAAAALITIPIAAGSLTAYLEYALTLLDGRINGRCNLASNTTNAQDKAMLSSVEMNALQKVIQNTRLSREGVPAEVQWVDRWFSSEDLLLMQDVRDKTKYVAKGYAKSESN